MRPVLVSLYQLGAIVSWVYLTFFNGFHYNWWNWIVVDLGCAQLRGGYAVRRYSFGPAVGRRVVTPPLL